MVKQKYNPQKTAIGNTCSSVIHKIKNENEDIIIDSKNTFTEKYPKNVMWSIPKIINQIKVLEKIRLKKNRNCLIL